MLFIKRYRIIFYRWGLLPYSPSSRLIPDKIYYARIYLSALSHLVLNQKQY